VQPSINKQQLKEPQRTQQQTRQDTPQPGAAQQEQKTVDAEYETVDG
jgi:hypothetical protein